MIRHIDTSKRVLLDYGNGKNKQSLSLNSIDLNDNIRAALTRFHIFTGNDYVLSFLSMASRAASK